MRFDAKTCCAAVLAAFAGLAALPVNNAAAQTLDTVRIASALEWPLFVTHAPGEPYYIYITLKRGAILRHDLRDNTRTTFIDLNSVILDPGSVNDERGLLGLAFHPDYATNGYFFVYYTANGGASQVVARYQRSSPGVGNPASATNVLVMSDQFSNHNGGWMAFHPTNGLLYIATGDGGSGNDPLNSGQDLNSLLGKMLRIDVDGPDNIPGNTDDDGFPADPNRLYTVPATNPFIGPIAGLDEIWAWGLRNPWRSSFDRQTGALYIGDVGQNAFEENNFQTATATGGQNYGWRCYEANSNTTLCGVLPAPVVFPWFTYGRTLGISTTGGYVYRGCAIPAIQGSYFLADFGSARVWQATGASASAPPTGVPVQIQTDLSPPIGGGSIASIASFGEDAFGELYIVRHSTASGEVFRIVPQGNPDLDCNNNNVADCGEIALGLVQDCNANAQIDSCEVASNPALDCNSNLQIDTCEIAANPALDCNSNSLLDTCEIAANPALDCDGNGQLDTCQIALDPTLDCNANSRIDACDIASNPALDCDTNALIDSCEIAANPALDCNASARLDTCEDCPGDADGDNDRDFADITAALSAFGTNYGTCLVGSGDADHDGQVAFGDITAVLNGFGQPCP